MHENDVTVSFRPSEILQDGIFSKGIPSNVRRNVRALFLTLELFNSDENLQQFVSEQCPDLLPWKYSIPEANSKAERIDAFIAFIHDKSHILKGNALVLFLDYVWQHFPFDATSLLN